MQIALVGLGRMGGNMVQRLLGGGHQIVAYDRDPKAVATLVEKGAVGASSIDDMMSKLTAPRAVWLMLPAGDPTESTMQAVVKHMSKGDIVVDGSNANWKDSQRRGEELGKQGIDFVDCGTSGGVWGLKLGYCLMVGGSNAAVERLAPIFTTLAPKDGWAHVGPTGAGHFTKMVHNGIEYGLMQAYAEGFEILEKSPFSPDLHKVTKLWNQGSVVRSWLLELAERAFEKDKKLDGIKGWVDDSGMGRWTVQAAIDEDVPAPVLTLALLQRFRSRQPESFAAKVCAALRNEFGGHAVKKNE
jgi:6-phosphogluconate dehydrogenase